jgi:signal transduction histidine kinase
MVWALNPHNDTLQQLIAYVSEHAIAFFENTAIEFDQEIPDEIPHILLDEEKRRALFLCIKEFLNNTLKHSGASQVKINWFFLKDGFRFTMKDNGHGFDIEETAKGGNGLRNMENRMKEIKASYLLHSDAEGTRVTVEYLY